MRFPPSSGLFFDYLANDNPVFMQTMLSDSPTKENQNVRKVIALIKKMGEVEDASDFYDSLEDNYPKSHRKHFTEDMTSSEEEPILNRMYSNFVKITQAISKKAERKPKETTLADLTMSVIEGEGNLEEPISTIYTKLTERDIKEGSSSRKSFLKELKRSLGLIKQGKSSGDSDSLRLNTVKFRESVVNYFRNEKKPTISEFLSISVPNFNYCLVRLEIFVPKNAKTKVRQLREKGWQEKNKKNLLILTKVSHVDDVEKTKSEIKLEDILTVDKNQIQVKTTYNFSILYEVLVKGDYFSSKMRKIIPNLADGEVDRYSRDEDNYSVGNITYSSIPKYLSILLAGKTKMTVELTDKKEVFSSNAIKQLLFATENRNLTPFVKSIYTSKKKKYQLLPLYESILEQETVNNPVSKAITSIGQDVKLNISQYSPTWIKRQVSELPPNSQITASKKLKAELKNPDSKAYIRRQRDFDDLFKRRKNIYSSNFIEFIKERYPSNFENVEFEEILVGEDKVYTTEDSKLLSSIRKIRNNSSVMDDFKDDFGKDEQIQVRALSSGTVDIPEVYTDALQKAIIFTISKFKENETLENFLGFSNLDKNSRPPMTLTNALFLSNFLAEKYGNQDTTQEVEKIDTSLKEGLSLSDATMKQQVEDLAQSINLGAKNFNALYLKGLQDKLKDIVENPKKYLGIYYSTTLDDLVRYGLLQED